MMNTPAKNEERALAPFVPMPPSLFGMNLFDRFFDGLNNQIAQQNIVHREVRDDGSTAIEYNLAGYEPEQVSVKVDTAQGQLIVSAKDERENKRKSFSTVLTLSAYTSPEDITTSYKNGILEIVVAPLEKRKEESLVEIPISFE